MRTGIRNLCSAGALIAAFAIVAPSGATAQGKYGENKVDKTKTHVTHVVQKPTKDKVVVTKTKKKVTPVRTRTRTVRTNRVYKTTSAPPRASARALERASWRSMVVRSRYYDTNATSAIARCADGTYYHYSYRNSACVGHGGVVQWFFENAFYNRDPSGAIARCFDGTYFHSISRQTACLRHGGVDFWM
ncbi:MAG TPA: DUF3761 domain-containing protein [Gemmatimonadaceae bacterium]|jgi:hypothetical protein